MADLNRRLLPAALLLVAAASFAAGCDIVQRATDADGIAQACDIEVLEPVIPPDSPEAIESSTLSVCDKAPESHIVTIYIEEELPGGVWSEVESVDGNLYTECTDIPGPGNNQLCSRWVPCLDGHYRTRVTVAGELLGQPFGFSPPETPDSWIRCPA